MLEEAIFLDRDEDGNIIEHYGTPRHSGRYPWGSGENRYQRNGGFLLRVQDLKAQGKTEKEIADSLNMSIRELRAKKAEDAERERVSRYNAVKKLSDKDWSAKAISQRLGIPETTVRDIMDKNEKQKINSLQTTANALKEAVNKDGYIDVGKGVEKYLGVTADKLSKATNLLKEEGYVVESMQVKQAATNYYTPLKILAPEGTTRKELLDNLGNVKLPFTYSQDGGETFNKKEPIVNIDNKRVYIRYNEDGGAEKEGVMELRRGVEDLNLGNAHYAQVRIGVEGTEVPTYLKGMAMYADDKSFKNLPKDVDIIFNTNKKKGTPPEKVFKEQKNDPDNPFGASLKTDDDLLLINRTYTDKDGNTKQSALNIVNEEGSWGKWSKTLASQMLSKQSPELAKKQLGIDADIRKADYDEIMSLTNPVVKERLLRSFADECDNAAVHLSAAAMPRQSTSVILPFPTLKNNEIYAPRYNNGEEVVLIRYPHGGIFEIPRLIVNNKNKEAKETIGNAKDAVGINATAAQQLSGADFDGDTVIVIPTKGQDIRTKKPYESLQNFDNKSYKIADDDTTTHRMTKVERNREMGNVTNLITDMYIKGASDDEIVRAVKHSMVVIDAYKHGLDYKQSEIDYDIAGLKTKYQGGAKRGASTLISRSTSEERVDKRKTYYTIDPQTGEKIWKAADPSQSEYSTPIRKLNKDTGEKEIVGWTKKKSTTTTTKGYEAKDAYELISEERTPIERVYADYANEMKALGNKARLESTRTGELPVNKQAKETYKKEIESLNRKLDNSLKNAPLERQAQLLANQTVAIKKQSNPELKDDNEALKKVKNQALVDARRTVGAKKELIEITDREWEAIQSGAISKTKLEDIIDNTDERRVKELSMPRQKVTTSDAMITKMKQMDRQGYTMAEISDRLGVSTSTISKYI